MEYGKKDNIKIDAFYSIAEIEFKELSLLSDREMQRYAKNNKLKRIDRRYLFTGYQLNEMNDFYRKKNDKKKMREEMREKLRLKKMSVTNLKDTTEYADKVGQIVNSELIRLRQENEDLKLKLSEEVPHQQKLKEAIQLITLEAMEQNVQHKIFSEEEYQDIIGTISEVEFQTKQVEYLKGRVEKQDAILHSLAKQIEQRNFIEAKEKGMDKE